MSDKKQFEKDSRFMIKPLSIEPKYKRPSFEMGGVIKYNFMIKAQLKDGTEVVFEYACPTQTPEAFFELNVLQWVKCTQPSEFACNIQPCDPPGEEGKAGLLRDARNLVEGALNTPTAKTTRYADPEYRKPVDVRGNPFSFIYAWAKDIVVAEMQAGINSFPEGVPLDPIKRISYYADEIHRDMMARVLQ